MATIAEQLTSLANTKTAIKEAIVAKGVQVADDTPFSGYAAKIGEIQGGGASATKFGASVDTWIGDVDANGVLQEPTWNGELNFAGVKTIGAYALYYRFPYLKTITSVNLSSLQEVGNNGLEYAFRGCSKLESINLSSLQRVLAHGLRYAFTSCTSITSVDLSSLETIGNSGLEDAFEYSTGIISVDLSSLKTVGLNGLSYAFSGCTKLLSVFFPSLTDVHQNALGSSTYNAPFRNCNALTELHFRKDAQAVIEGLSSYSVNFGATNATIYFDLIGTITVGGVAYARDEKQSIRVDGTKTFVGWKDTDGNVVYTSYENNAEPAVGTVVYSDAGTTQVGTVEGVA